MCWKRMERGLEGVGEGRIGLEGDGKKQARGQDRNEMGGVERR